MPPHPEAPARECSPFLDQAIRRHPDWFEDLRQQGRLEGASAPDPDRLSGLTADLGLNPALRQFRNQEMMRIVWRELTRTALLEETFADLSRLAETCLQEAIDHHSVALSERHGVPRDNEGARQALVVIGMGKLGGNELNLSSDIDLIFCYPRAGACDGPRASSNEQYFTRLTRQVIKSLSEMTEHGFCFRVDTRLRPFGESGPLVCSFGAMEQYYQREGRDWERYALVKARPVAGDLGAGQDLLRVLTPFVYRRYIDFGAVEALREMHQAVRKDAAQRGREHDIKRGPGGIREIEFLVQAFQLLRGGREPRLQTPSLFHAIDGLVELGSVPPETAQALRSHYRFLRRLENAIQALHDQQTHLLPEGEDLARVARAMGYGTPAELGSALAEVRGEVGALFQHHLQPAEPVAAENSWMERWRSLKDGGDAPGPSEPAMARFLERLGRQSLSQRAAQRLDRFMPIMLERLERRGLAPEVLSDVLELVLAITRRSAYLALLVQNPAALDRMIGLFQESGWIAATVIRHPALLDELIDPTLGRLLPSPDEITAMADRVLRSHDNIEGALLALNYMKLATSLRVAVAELETTLSAGEVQQTLTRLAEALLEACLRLASQEVRARFPSAPEDDLCVIGYGSLGASELAFGSDLDLIFLYQGPAALDGQGGEQLERFHTRVARRLISLLTLPTPSGRLYSTDTRLRPNGRAGLLVSSLAAFEKYQTGQAWTWELQALTRARAVAGNATVAGQFARIREAALARPRAASQLREQVLNMRRRMRAEFHDKDPFKHGPGGLIDIDFIAQLGVLETASREPTVLASIGTPAQLRALARAGWLSDAQAEGLAAAHESLCRARHLSSLARGAQPEHPDLAPSKALCAALLGSEARAWFSPGSSKPGSISPVPDGEHSG